MLFWIVAALLTLGASLAVLLPLTRRAGPAGAGSDIEVYRDQLAELERDAARGLIGAAEADEARAEIGRRILRADAEAKAAARPQTNAATRLIAAGAVLAVPLLSWGIYAGVGSPDLPSQPLAERLAQNPADSPVEELVARAEAHLAGNPDDGHGWDVLAPVYLRLGRVAEAVNAYRNAIRLAGATAAREAGLGEALAAAGGGMVSAEARAAFERALALEPGEPRARFFLATAMAQDGRMEEAAAAWRAMLATLAPDSPWRRAAGQAVAEAEARIAAAAPGPDEGQVRDMAALPEAERAAMIETMVASLDERLRDNPQDVDGWTRLVRSYLVLGRTDAARDALKRGTQALGAGTAAAARLIDFAGTLGLTPADGDG